MVSSAVTALKMSCGSSFVKTSDQNHDFDAEICRKTPKIKSKMEEIRPKSIQDEKKNSKLAQIHHYLIDTVLELRQYVLCHSQGSYRPGYELYRAGEKCLVREEKASFKSRTQLRVLSPVCL